MTFRYRLSVYACAALLFGACDPKPAADDLGNACESYRRTPVLFVHGSGLSSSSWANTIRVLGNQGYPPSHLFAIDLAPDNGDNILAAELQISPAIEKLLGTVATRYRRNGCTGTAPSKVAIVAHSMGAASSRWYAAKIAPQRVRLLVTIAGANHGTNALCGLDGPGNRQMCPAFSDESGPGAIQALLNGTRAEPIDETPFGIGEDSSRITSKRPTVDKNILYITVRIDPDRWIDPPTSAELDGAGGNTANLVDLPLFEETSPGNYLFKKPVIHDHLPADSDVANFIGFLLRQRP